MNNLEDSYKLRYKVYCLDKNFLSKQDYIDGVEFDKYDEVAKHFYYLEDNKVKGTIRLVPWSVEHTFPTEDHFSFLLGILGGLDYPIDMTAEISRFCISRSCFDKYFATMELFKEIYHYSKRNDITHWIATFERSLFILLKRQGFIFKLLSDIEIDYFGKVNLYGISIEELEDNIKRNKPSLYYHFNIDL